eukprot:gene25158-10788_t
MATAQAALRTLLRSVNKNLTSVAGNSQWRDHVITSFRESNGRGGGRRGDWIMLVDLQDNLEDGELRHGDCADKEERLQLARDCAFLMKNVAHHQALLKLYNIGTEESERNKDMVAKTAARVGFSMPVANPPS